MSFEKPLEKLYPNLYSVVLSALRKCLNENKSVDVENLEYIHSKIFSAILSEGYTKVISDYSIHVVVNENSKIDVYFLKSSEDIPQILFL